MTDTPPHQPGPRRVHLDDTVFDTLRTGGSQTVLVAPGGWCAPAAAGADLLYLRPPWAYPDDGWATELDVAGWLFPRWARLERAAGEGRRRLGVCRRVLTTGTPDPT